MLDLLFQGGILFMGILTLILLAVFAITVILALQLVAGKVNLPDKTRHQLTYIKSVGLFAFIFGIFGQAIGLYQAFIDIEKMESISPALLAAGLRVSSITSIYGIIIFLLSYLLWFSLESLLNQRTTNVNGIG
ncbi:MotA/TolQ/ExbB proton channel family protein [Rhodocytophaga aerolata]|uniref:MotA/TolQ/ExbB proton channel family protein n=1 Tax=Rhodocytophaga aerolata TaxID=455078 RepID=A0ABT8R6B9_9BACT|nr:MotA/TolQ/ExbB proton channel family protein [Rhodocytophaga aerolata]MDO1447206.1 MotA/TolQ/ExbB proton channel family protein [Rhodocytophaga aerolata]